MSNILSNTINIFPLNKPREDYQQDNLLYEANIANLIAQLLDVDGFIIEAPEIFNDINATNPLIVNIKGYHIRITDKPSDFPSASAENIYLKLKLKINETTALTEVDGQDSDNMYSGVEFVDTIDTTNNIYFLHIYSKDNEQFKIVNESKNKFNLSSLNISRIDGKR